MSRPFKRIAAGLAGTSLALGACSVPHPPTRQNTASYTPPVVPGTSAPASPNTDPAASAVPRGTVTQTGRTALSFTFDGTPNKGTFNADWQTAAGRQRVANMLLECIGDIPTIQMKTYKNGSINYTSSETTFRNAGGVLCNSEGNIRPTLREHPAAAASTILAVMQSDRAFDAAVKAYEEATK